MSYSVLQTIQANTSGSATTLGIAITPHAIGNKIIAYVTAVAGAAPSITGVSDGTNSLVAIAGPAALGSTFGTFGVYCYDAVGTSAVTITATQNGASGPGISMQVQEVSGLTAGTSGILDAAAASTTGAALASPETGPAYTSTGAGDFMAVCYFGDGSGTTWAKDAAGSAYTAAAGNTSANAVADVGMAHKAAAPGAETTGIWDATGTASGYAIVAFAIKLPGGGGGPVLPNPVGATMVCG